MSRHLLLTALLVPALGCGGPPPPTLAVSALPAKPPRPSFEPASQAVYSALCKLNRELVWESYLEVKRPGDSRFRVELGGDEWEKLAHPPWKETVEGAQFVSSSNKLYGEARTKYVYQGQFVQGEFERDLLVTFEDRCKVIADYRLNNNQWTLASAELEVWGQSFYRAKDDQDLWSAQLALELSKRKILKGRTIPLYPAARDPGQHVNEVVVAALKSAEEVKP